MNIDSSLKKGIVASLVATLMYLYLIDPILHMISFLVLHSFGALSRRYVDRLFEEAALLSSPDSSMIVLSVCLATVCGLATGVLFALVWRAGVQRTRVYDGIKRSTLWTFCSRAFIVVAYFATLFASLLIIHITAFENRITSSFNQHLAAIAPHVSDQEIKIFRSRWTQMTGQGDYANIYVDLRRVAATNSVRLPENKMMPFP